MKMFKILCYGYLLIFILGVSPSFCLDIDTSSQFLYPEYSKKISMDFENAPLVDVLKIFSKQTDLNLITSDAVSNQTVTVYLDDVPVDHALEQILRANNLTYEIQPGSDIYIIKKIQRPEIELVTRVYPLKHASVSSAQINSALSIDGISNSSGNNIITALKSVITSSGKISEDSRTNSMIVTDIATNFPMIEQTIVHLDISVPQILIEVEMLDVSTALTDNVGIDWSGEFMTFTGGAKTNVIPFDGSLPFFDAPGGGIDYTVARFTTSSMSAEELTATLYYLITNTDTKSLARPSILTLNNQSAEIKIVTDEATSIDSTVSDSGNVTRTAAVRTETGVTLIVTPQANLETGIITMVVKPTVSVATTSKLGDVTIKDPEIRSAQTMMKVKSGNTIIIGGLIREETSETIRKIPILGDIPILGMLFRNTNITKDERELLIFITPHIILDEPTSMLPKHASRKLLREQSAP